MKLVERFLFFVFLGLLAGLPVFYSQFKYEFVDDMFYYLARAREVTSGFWQVGNPYFWEHRDDLAVSFFVPDWLTAIPFSFLIWPIIIAVLIFVLLKKLGIGGKLLYFGSTLCYLSVYNFIVRPTSMATIYPFFLLLLTSLLAHKRLFILSAVLTFYIYAYLWQMAVIILLLYCFIVKFERKFLLIFLLTIPAFYYLFLQINSPYYWETMRRIGLVETRLPTVASFYFAFWTSFSFLPAIILATKKFRTFFTIIFLSFLILLFSNAATGKELETANHVGRFIVLAGSISIVYAISKTRKALILLVIWFLVFRSNFSVLFSFTNKNLRSAVQTNNYVLFHPLGGLHLMSSDELLERYLVWKYPEKLTLEVLVNDFRSYAGTGPAIHQVAQYNYRVRQCRIFWKQNCGEIKETLSYYGQDYFQKILTRYEQDIYPNITKYYQKYHVTLLSGFSR